MNRLSRAGVLALMLGVLAALTGVALWQTARAPRWRVYTRTPPGIMGTSCTLIAVVPGRDAAAIAHRALDAAEQALRRSEALMSGYLDDSEVSAFNRGPAGRYQLSHETVQVVAAARGLYERTAGSFDITCGPLIDLWQAAGRSGRNPTADQIAEARAASSWGDLQIEQEALTKTRGTVRIDLGGITKGFAIDRAVEAMAAQGAVGGLVDVGGDLRCFGRPPEGPVWTVGIRDPAQAQQLLGTVHLPSGAVCTSGDYFRFVEIDGRRYSHILDPRTGRPSQATRSVTVIGPEALGADGWATALSVLGADAGSQRLPVDDGYAALLVVREPGAEEEGVRRYIGPFPQYLAPPPSPAGPGRAAGPR